MEARLTDSLIHCSSPCLLSRWIHLTLSSALFWANVNMQGRRSRPSSFQQPLQRYCTLKNVHSLVLAALTLPNIHWSIDWFTSISLLRSFVQTLNDRYTLLARVPRVVSRTSGKKHMKIIPSPRLTTTMFANSWSNNQFMQTSLLRSFR